MSSSLRLSSDEIVAELCRGSGDVEMMIDQIVFVSNYAARAEELQQIFGVVAAVANPLAAEDLAAVDVNAIDVAVLRVVEGAYFGCKFG